MTVQIGLGVGREVALPVQLNSKDGGLPIGRQLCFTPRLQALPEELPPLRWIDRG